jgi:hypothetical protein
MGEGDSIFCGHNILNPLLLNIMKTNRRSISRNHNILNPHPYRGGRVLVTVIFRCHNILNPLLLTMKTQKGVIIS